MRLLAWAAGVSAAAALAVPAAPATAETNLRIVVWPNGKAAPSRQWTLRCGPTGGSLPRRARACRLLSARRRPFRAVPRDAVCTAVYGGPAVATVRGRFRGNRVRTSFKRTDGCQIARWDRVRFLFPASPR